MVTRARREHGGIHDALVDPSDFQLHDGNGWRPSWLRLVISPLPFFCRLLTPAFAFPSPQVSVVSNSVLPSRSLHRHWLLPGSGHFRNKPRCFVPVRHIRSGCRHTLRRRPDDHPCQDRGRTEAPAAVPALPAAPTTATAAARALPVSVCHHANGQGSTNGHLIPRARAHGHAGGGGGSSLVPRTTTFQVTSPKHHHSAVPAATIRPTATTQRHCPAESAAACWLDKDGSGCDLLCLSMRARAIY